MRMILHDKQWGLSQKCKVGGLPKVHLANYIIFILQSINLVSCSWSCTPGNQSIDHRERPFSRAVESGLLAFFWGVLHRCSPGLLACNFLFLEYLWIWRWCEKNAGLVKWVCKCPHLFGRVWDGLKWVLL